MVFTQKFRVDTTHKKNYVGLITLGVIFFIACLIFAFIYLRNKKEHEQVSQEDVDDILV